MNPGHTAAENTARRLIGTLLSAACCASPSGAADLERLLYRNPGLVVDLAVGLWASPLPMDYDGDGDMDLVVVCSDKPYNGTWLFENPGGGEMPVFEPARLIGPGPPDVQVSYAGGEPRVLVPGHEYADFRSSGLGRLRRIYPQEQIHPTRGRVRANQWKYADWEGDGDLDLIVGVGDWTDYGWDDAFDARGNWTRGPLRGFVYLILNRGSSAAPLWAAPERIEAGGRPLEVFGMPSPNLADMDGDGDLDIVCGEFLDRLTYFENVGRRGAPRYARVRYLSDGSEPIRLDLQMIVPVAVDWDADGDVDLVVGEEDGRVALVENTGALVGGRPSSANPATSGRRRARSSSARWRPLSPSTGTETATRTCCSGTRRAIWASSRTSTGATRRAGRHRGCSRPAEPWSGSRPAGTGRSRGRPRPSGATRRRVSPTGTGTAGRTCSSTRSGAPCSGIATWAAGRGPCWPRRSR